MKLFYVNNVLQSLTHWGRVTHICVSKLTIISSDNGLSPSRRQAIIWTNAGILSIGPLGTNFSETLIANQTISLRKMHLKMSSAKSRPFCLGLNVLSKHCLGRSANCQSLLYGQVHFLMAITPHAVFPSPCFQPSVDYWFCRWQADTNSSSSAKLTLQLSHLSPDYRSAASG